ncbi:MAG: nucleoside triphosphate pyrophosphohydrolase family protein [Minisyncoccales bacterium]
MTFEEYQKISKQTAVYPDVGNNYIYPTLGLAGEAGEVAEKMKKVIRDDKGKITEKKKQELKKEMGDVLWYLSQLARELGLSLDDIAAFNVEKLQSRQERGKLKGSGDNR